MKHEIWETNAGRLALVVSDDFFLWWDKGEDEFRVSRHYSRLNKLRPDVTEAQFWAQEWE